MATYYVAASGGNDTNPGTITQPWATWQKGFSTAVAGDIVYIRGGVYYVTSTPAVYIDSKNGTSGSRITIQNYPGETPILDGTNITTTDTRRGVEMVDCSYWTLKGLTVRNVREYTGHIAESIWMNRCNYFNIEQCVVHGCGDGFALLGNSDYVYYTNCDAYNNWDVEADSGGYSNGFSLNLYISSGSPNVHSTNSHIYLTGCRAWANSDDGFDLYGASSYFTFTNCWSFGNGKDLNGNVYGGNANGSGFKLGAANQGALSGSPVQRTLITCLSFNNKGTGTDQSRDGMGDLTTHIYNCTSYNNLQAFSYFSSTNTNSQITNHLSSTESGNNTGSVTITTTTYNANTSNFVSIDATGMNGARQSDGSLPILNFLKLASGSSLIAAGTPITGLTLDGAGNLFDATAPSVGAYQYGASGAVLMQTLNIAAAGGATTVSTYHGTLQFSVIGYTPANTTNTDVTWSVVNGTGSGTIDSNGLFTAATNGTVTIWAHNVDNNDAWDYYDLVLSNQIQAGYATIITTAISGTTKTSANSGGNVTADGGSSISEKGICYSTSYNPTISDTKVIGGTGLGSFTSSMTGLIENTTYHVRAYATNSTGTSYGADISFVTRSFMIVVW